jgi:hypothetical protein
LGRYKIVDNDTRDEYDNILKTIIEMERDGLDEEYRTRVLQDYSLLFGTLFKQYSRNSNQYVNISRERENSFTDNREKSDRKGVHQQVRDDVDYSRKE